MTDIWAEERMLIGGALVAAASGQTYVNVDPATEQVLGVTADGGPAKGATVSAAAMHYKPALRHQAKTDTHGQFRFDLQPLTGAQRWSVCARLGRQGGEANALLGR